MKAKPKATKVRPRRVDPSKIRKLSTLLALGLRDARRQELAKNSVLSMTTWLATDAVTGMCFACLAGSVLRFECPRKARKIANGAPIEPWMKALDALRIGMVGEAAFCLRVSGRVPDRDVHSYRIDPAGWWADMRELLADPAKGW